MKWGSVILVWFCLLPGTGAEARTWMVSADGSGDAPTVQAAIDSASAGDVVLLGPGTYFENINLLGKAIELTSQFGPGSAILDGSLGDGPVVTCNSGEGHDTIIEGLTITGGSGMPYSGNRVGGGIICDDSAPVVRGNVVRKNELIAGGFNSRGAAIFVGPAETSTILDGNILEDNYSAGNGGCINIAGPCVIQNNVIQHNRTGAGDGAGVRYEGGAPTIVRRNLIRYNIANDHGGGLYIGNSNFNATDVDISYNIILGNVAYGADGAVDCSGGGIWLSRHGAFIHNNTIAFNRADRVYGGFAPVGGICELNPNSDVIVEQNILYHNLDGGIGVYGLSNDASVWIATFRHNLIYDNGRQDVYSDTYDPRAMVQLMLDENVFADPMFCSAGVDERAELAGASPAFNQPFGVIGAVDVPGCGPYLVGLGDGRDVPDTTLCSCEFPDFLDVQSPPDTIRVTLVSSVGRIQSSYVEARIVLEAGDLLLNPRLVASAITDRNGQAELIFPDELQGEARFHFAVTAGVPLCRSRSYTVDTTVKARPITWGRLKARYQ